LSELKLVATGVVLDGFEDCLWNFFHLYTKIIKALA
jgi:hypothetical protein